MSFKTHFDLIIIGGGSAGLSLASASAQVGVQVLLIDREQLGGDCLHYGCVPSKALIKSGKIAHYAQIADQFGVTTPKPKTDWKAVTQRIKNIQKPIQKHDSAERFRSLGAEVVFGSASFTGSHKIQVELNPKLAKLQPSFIKASQKTANFTADKICIATGSRPRVLNIPGLSEAGSITNEDLFTLPTQPKSLAIIGGGVIASEMAQAMQRLGTEVTILEKYKTFYGRFDAPIRETISRVFNKEGISVLTNVNITKVESTKTKKIIHYNNGKILTVDEILLATGRVPNTNIGLEKAGVEFSDRGIPTNAKLRTNIKHITAIGDVNGQSMFTHTANYEAGIVFSNEILKLPTKADYNTIGWTIYTDPEIASIGLDVTTALAKGIKHEVIHKPLTENDRAQSESETEGFIQIIVSPRGQILGCQIMSPRAGEMIREWQLAISQKMKLSTIARSTYIYPTFGEISKWAAGGFYAPKLFNPRVKKILKTLWGYGKSGME